MFCTYLTIYRGRNLPPFYIGHTAISKIEKGYHGSVSSKKYQAIWKYELLSNPHLFSTHILSTHTTRQEAVSKEVFFQLQLRVVENELYINAAVATGRPSLLGVKKSAEHKRKISESKIGKGLGRKMPPRTEEWRQKQRIANLGKKFSDETKLKMAKSHTGTTRSSETKLKMSEAAKARWASNKDII